MKHVLIGVAALALPFAGVAQTVVVSNGGPSPVAPSPVAPPVAPSSAAVTAPVMDPATMAAAQKVVDHTFPPGLYKKMMGPMMSKMMDGMFGQMSDLPLKQFAKMGGARPEEVAKLDKVTLGQIAEIMDPAYHRRMKIMMDTMFSGMGDMMNALEPDIRAGYVDYYAQHYSAAQLGELNAFFDTPTGSAYASQSMLIAMDPTVMTKMQNMIPAIMKAMPALMDKVKKAEDDAHLPPQRNYNELTPAERAKFKKLIGGGKN